MSSEKWGSAQLARQTLNAKRLHLRLQRRYIAAESQSRQVCGDRYYTRDASLQQRQTHLPTTTVEQRAGFANFPLLEALGALYVRTMLRPVFFWPSGCLGATHNIFSGPGTYAGGTATSRQAAACCARYFGNC